MLWSDSFSEQDEGWSSWDPSCERQPGGLRINFIVIAIAIVIVIVVVIVIVNVIVIFIHRQPGGLQINLISGQNLI